MNLAEFQTVAQAEIDKAAKKATAVAKGKATKAHNAWLKTVRIGAKVTFRGNLPSTLSLGARVQ